MNNGIRLRLSSPSPKRRRSESRRKLFGSFLASTRENEVEEEEEEKKKKVSFDFKTPSTQDQCVNLIKLFYSSLPTFRSNKLECLPLLRLTA